MTRDEFKFKMWKTIQENRIDPPKFFHTLEDVYLMSGFLWDEILDPIADAAGY